MYDRFKMQFLEELQDSFSPEEIKTISSKLDFVSVNYKIEKMCTDIVVYEGGFPQEAKDYLISKKIKGLADGTLKNYMLLLNNFFNTVRKPLDKIETRDIVAFMYI